MICPFSVNYETKMYYSQGPRWISPGNPYWRGRISTVDLLIKIGRFVKQQKNLTFNLNQSALGGPLY